MKRLAPVVGVAIVLGSLAVLLLLVGPLGDPDPLASDSRDRADPPRPTSDPSARAAMDRAAAAPSSWAYEGTQFVAARGAGRDVSQVIEVSHSPEEGTTWRPSTGGPGVTVAPHDAKPSILGAGTVGLIARYYSLRTGIPDRVAGRDADVVEAYRPDAPAASTRPVARFWLDRVSGLVLRREVYEGRRTVRASAFVDLDVAPAPTMSTTPESGEGSAWKTTLDAQAVDRMSRHGWDCPDTLPGPLPLVDARKRGGSGAWGGSDSIIHLSYADGIRSISVFQQHGRLDEDMVRRWPRHEVDGQPVWVKEGVPRRVVWSSGGTVYTVLGDAPRRTVDRAVAVLHAEASRGQKGPADRLGRGLDRVVSWFNPFE